MEFSAEDIIQFEHQVKYVMDHATLYADQEKCEAFARLGIANFFGGQYTKAITALEEALKYKNVAKPDKYIVFVYVLLGNIFFRCCDLNRSEKHFKSAIMLPKVDEGLACIALSNTAIIKVALNNMKSASEKASEAIKMASRLYPPSSEECLSAVRTLIFISLKNHDFNHVIQLVHKHPFHRKEKALYLAGCYFSLGNLKEGRQILQDALGDKDNPTSFVDSDRLSHQDLDGNQNKEDYNYGAVNDLDLDASKAGTSGDLNLSAQISYNIGVMRSKKGFDYEQSHRYLNESIQKMEEAINVQQEEMLSARHLRDENYDVFTNYLSPDRLLAPAVVMSHFLTAKAETSFLGHAYNAGINLQTGVIITGRDAELDILSETQRVIDKSVRTLESHSRNTLAEHLSQQTLDSGGTGNVTNAAHFEVLASVSSTFSHRSLLQTAEPLLSATEFPTIYSAVMPGSPSGALVEAPALLLDATKAEKFTLRSELFPVDKDLSITEVDYWIQWALAQGGIGLGFMLGSGVILDVEQSKMLTKIRFRLVDLYGRKDVRIDDGRKLLLLAALCKLSAQLRLIEEVGKYLVKFEDVVEVYGDPYYHAISRRFRLDYADWTDLYVKESSNRPSESEAQDLDTDVDITDAGEAEAAAVTIPILMRKMQLAKEYYKLAELTLDIHLRRDSMKRVMNSFTEISLSMTVEHMEVISEEEEELSRRSSLKKLQFFTAKEIDLYEKTDPIWVKQFSYARAQQFATMLSKTCK